jgi:hypothetical protein
MNDGVTVCINTLRSIFAHLEDSKNLNLGQLDNDELAQVLVPYATKVGSYFGALNTDQVRQFRSLRGVQGQTTALRRVQQALRNQDPGFDPVGLSDFVNREKLQTTTRAFQIVQGIEKRLQQIIIDELKAELGPSEEEWWFTGVPKGVRKKVDERRNEEGGKNTREQNFDLIDYREIIHHNKTLFDPLLTRGKGSKESRTKWLVELNELRKPIMHASKGVHMPITEDQLNQLLEIEMWLAGQIENELDSTPLIEEE